MHFETQCHLCPRDMPPQAENAHEQITSAHDLGLLHVVSCVLAHNLAERLPFARACAPSVGVYLAILPHEYRLVVGCAWHQQRALGLDLLLRNAGIVRLCKAVSVQSFKIYIYTWVG